MVPIFKGKGDAMNCMVYRRMKLLEQAMKIVEKVLKRRLWCMVKVDEMQFGFMPGKGMIDAAFILRRLQVRGILKRSCTYICASLIWRRHLTGSNKQVEQQIPYFAMYKSTF